MEPIPRAPARRGGSESGSAYILALLALLVLSIVGLSLIFITETESQIGVSERMLARTFYAADSGIPIAVARRQSLGDYSPFRFVMNDDDPSIFQRFDQVQTNAVFMVQFSHCDTCDAAWNAPGGTGGGSGTFKASQYVSPADATRMAASGAGANHPVARQNVSAYVLIQPDQGPSDLRSQGREHGEKVAEGLQGNYGGRSGPGSS